MEAKTYPINMKKYIDQYKQKAITTFYYPNVGSMMVEMWNSGPGFKPRHVQNIYSGWGVKLHIGGLASMTHKLIVEISESHKVESQNIIYVFG